MLSSINEFLGRDEQKRRRRYDREIKRERERERKRDSEIKIERDTEIKREERGY